MNVGTWVCDVENGDIGVIVDRDWNGDLIDYNLLSNGGWFVCWESGEFLGRVLWCEQEYLREASTEDLAKLDEDTEVENYGC